MRNSTTRKITVTDTILRDAHNRWWPRGMRTEDMLADLEEARSGRLLVRESGASATFRACHSLLGRTPGQRSCANCGEADAQTRA